MWEQALTGLQEAYKPQITQIQEAANYDISQAYANYKKSQMSLLQNKYIGSGLREKFSKDLESAYGASYLQSKAKEAQSLYETQSAFGKDVAALESQFAEYGEKLAALDKAIYEKAGLDINKARLTKEEGGLGHYETRNGGVYLTAEGTSFYDQMLSEITSGGENATQSLDDYLIAQGYDDLYQFYATDPEKIRTLLGGKEVADAAYTSDEKSRIGAAEAKRKYEKYLGKNITDKTFDSYQEEERYYTTQYNIDTTIEKLDTLLSLPDNALIQNTLLSKTVAPEIKRVLGAYNVNIDKDGDKFSLSILGANVKGLGSKLEELGFSKARVGTMLQNQWTGNINELKTLISELYNLT